MSIDTKKYRQHMAEWAKVWGEERASREGFAVKGADLVVLLDVYDRVHELANERPVIGMWTQAKKRAAARQTLAGASKRAYPRKGRRPRAATPTSRPRRRR